MKIASYFLLHVFVGALFMQSAKPSVAAAKEFEKITLPSASRILVQLKEKTTNPDGTQRSQFDLIDVGEFEDIDEKVVELRNSGDYLNVAANYFRGVNEITPDDTQVADQYAVDITATANINVAKAWEVTKGKKRVVVAVIDTGVDTNHEDIKGKVWKNVDEIKDNGKDDDGNGYVDDYRGWNFYADTNNPNPNFDSGSNDSASHGTHVAGIIGANTNNATGVAGVGWNTSIMALNVAQPDGTMSDSAISEAIEYAVNNGADIINMSLGGFGTSTVLEAAVQYAIESGVIVVVAAGNEGINLNNFPYQPANIDGVVTVAATDSEDAAASFSNFGSSVDIAAPGVSIMSSLYHDEDREGFTTKYAAYSGTSMATPIVAAVFALMRAQEPDLTPAQALQALQAGAKDVGLADTYGAGRVDALGALFQLDSVKPVHIKGYAKKSAKKQMDKGARKKSRQPVFQWSAPKIVKSNIKGYYVYFGPNKDANPFKKGEFREKRQWRIPQLDEANNKTYYLRVGVRKTDGSNYDKKGTFKYILDNRIGSAPVISALNKVDAGVKVTWEKSADTYVNKYHIRRKKAGDDAYTTVEVVDGDSTTYTDSTAKTGNTYVYTIRAIDSKLDLKKASASKSISL